MPRRHCESGRRRGCALTKPLINYDERIECVFSEDGAIAGTKVITVRDRSTGVVVLRFRRYDWESIGRWFEAEGFDVASAMCSLSSPADKFGMGVILLTRGGHR
jgi:hypothetical protein